MKPIVITGPESLIRAAFDETEKVLGKKYCTPPPTDAKGQSLTELFISSSLVYQLTQKLGLPNQPEWQYLTLPADWDKLMGILADLKKPKLPEYVRGESTSLCGVYKVVSADEPSYETHDVYGNVRFWPKRLATPITEQEFIDGGLKELADAGYVKGAKVSYVSNFRDRLFTVEEVVYQSKTSEGAHSGLSHCEVSRAGFSFSATGSGYRVPVGKCTLIPTLPTTSEGIPYTISSNLVYVGTDTPITLHKATIQSLINAGTTELVTKAGRLTQADLELLTK